MSFVVCPGCSVKIAIPKDVVARKGKCPRCRTVIRFGEETPEKPARSAAPERAKRPAPVVGKPARAAAPERAKRPAPEGERPTPRRASEPEKPARHVAPERGRRAAPAGEDGGAVRTKGAARRRTTTRRARRTDRKPSGASPWLWIGLGGGAGAILVATILVVVLAGGGSPSSTVEARSASAAGATEAPETGLPESKPGEETERPPEAAPEDPEEDLAGPGRGELLRRRIGRDIRGLEVEGDRLTWGGESGERFTVVDDALGDPVLGTAVGRLTASADLLDSDPDRTAATLANLVTRAREAGLGAKTAEEESELELADDVLVGLHLAPEGGERIVLPEGVLVRESLAESARDAEREALEAAVARFRDEVAGTALPDLARGVVSELVGRLSARDDPAAAADDTEPSFARRLVRHGWLRGLGPVGSLASVSELESRVRESERFAPVEAHRGDGVTLAKLRDAFGREAWLLTTPDRTVYALPPALPKYHPIAERNLREDRLVVRLPGGFDPVADPAAAERAIEIRLVHGSDDRVRWSESDGFRADLASWRRAVPGEGAKGLVADYLPPHLVLVDLAGDVRRIVTAGGAVDPPKDGSSAEAERFLAEAAKVLADPTHLDLLGQYMVEYVYDSPDSAAPTLIGSKTQHGDIHQTAEQTLGTVAGGICRGDCDDLSELYVNLATRQGKVAHVVHLPAHAAAAWAESREDGWHTYVLQTGPALEFVAPALPESLAKAYEHFDATERFDPDNLAILLRFSGENTRNTYWLGWRIFAEADYARTMVDVQQDWHFQTYLQAISKMRALIEEKGDQDASNYKEIASLYEVTAQFPLALECRKKALAQAKDADGRYRRSLEIAQCHFAAKDYQAGRAIAQELLDKDIPALFGGLDVAQSIGVALEFVQALADGKAYDLAARAFMTYVHRPMDMLVRRFAAMVQQPGFERSQFPSDPAMENLFREYSRAGVSILEGLALPDPSQDATVAPMFESLRIYFDTVAIFEAPGGPDLSSVYARIAGFYAVVLGPGELEKRLEAAPYPAAADHDHWRRTGGPGQIDLDLPWIKASVDHWFARVLAEIDDEKTGFDRTRVARLAGHLQRAVTESPRLGLVSATTEFFQLLGSFLAALAAEDDPAIRRHFRYVREKNDTRMRDQTAYVFGQAARLLPLEAFGRAMAIWKEELDYKPKYYAVAWLAARSGGPDHALLVARIAAERFKDDPAFVAECEFMKKLYRK